MRDDLQNVSLLNILPPNLAADKGVQMQAEAFDETLREIIAKIPDVCIVPRVHELTDSLLLDLLAWQFHVDFYDSSMPVELKRILVQRSLDWHARKGTPSVIEEAVTETLAKAEVSEWYEYFGEPGHFRLSVYGGALSKESWNYLINTVYFLKNVRSWLESIKIITEVPEATLYTGGAIAADTQRIEVKTKDIDNMAWDTELYMGGAIVSDVQHVGVKTKDIENRSFETKLYAMGAIAMDAEHIGIRTRDIVNMRFDVQLGYAASWWDVSYVSIPTKIREEESH